MTPVLLDQGLPATAASLLREQGWDAVHVSELGLAMAEDLAILERSRLEQRVCVTLDADFHALLCMSGAAQPSVIRIRIEGLRGPEAAELIQRVVNQTAHDLQRGAMVTVTKHSVRIHRIPID
jgi:predicted nuclease of predicted toxin-antitoxin system